MIIDRSREATGVLRFVEFFLTRNIGTLVDCGVLWLFADLVFKGSYVGENIISPTISFEVATFVNYVTSYLWIWSTRIEDHGKRWFFRRFLTFNLSSVLGFLIKMFFLLLCEHLFGWHVVICNLVALTVSGFFNFFLAEMWVFGKKRPRPARELISPGAASPDGHGPAPAGPASPARPASSAGPGPASAGRFRHAFRLGRWLREYPDQGLHPIH